MDNIQSQEVTSYFNTNQFLASNQIQVKRLDENFLSHLKRKRKLSTDSLEELLPDEEKNSSTLQNVEHFLNETGLNAQLIAKNDKKLIKLNINSTNTCNNGVRVDTSINKVNLKSSYLNYNEKDFEMDDLPSESDVSTGTVLIPINSTPQINAQTLKNDIDNSSSSNQSAITNQKSITLCFKCNKCSHLFCSEEFLKAHQESECLSINEQFQNANTNDLIFSDQFSMSANDLTYTSDNKIQHNQIDDSLSPSNSSTLISASSTKQNKKRTFICTECGVQFHLQNDLNKHMLQVHENVRPYTCSKCDMAFFELSTKNRHEKEHAGLKPFRCYICSFEFTRASNLRTHLLKVHPNDIGKLVNITKSIDNKLKFEFNLEAINFQREQNKLSLVGTGSTPPKSSNDSYGTSSQTTPKNNTVIYIKDPNNKNAEIQHMIVYVDGKPIFVQNPKLANSNNQNSFNNNKDNHVLVNNSTENIEFDVGNKKQKQSRKSSKNSSTSVNKPIAKIPYLLAAAAAAAASNHRKQQQQQQLLQQQQQQLIQQQQNNFQKVQYNTNQKVIINTNDTTSRNSSTALTVNPGISNNETCKKELKQDQEYLQLVSMLKQKNEKLYNPLLNKSYY